MSDRTAEFLAEQKRLTEAATPGPWTWAAHTTVDVEAWAVFDPRDWAVADNGDGFKADAEFIAAARSSVPKLIAAVEAVMAMHRRSHAVFSWATGGVRFEDPCPDCDGKAGVHPCGCWADVDIEYVCAECDKSKERAAWPCPTIRAIEAALGGEGDGE